VPNVSLRACAGNLCPEIVQPPERYCDECRTIVDQQDRERRGTARERGYNSRWEQAALTFKRKHPLCAECLRQGRVTPGTQVDHIIAHKGDQHLFWDTKNNWQNLCVSCHSSKSAREDGGFGHPRRNGT
jgi:5-methylcytosine-specific restriction protein A